jgi:hypothetical protein
LLFGAVVVVVQVPLLLAVVEAALPTALLMLFRGSYFQRLRWVQVGLAAEALLVEHLLLAPY